MTRATPFRNGKPRSAPYFFSAEVKLVMSVIGWFTCCETRSIRNRLPSGETLKNGIVRIVRWLTTVWGAPNCSAPPPSCTETPTTD